MKILYVGCHGQRNNDDEGAIAYALEQLGHTVAKVPEDPKQRPGLNLVNMAKGYDLCLCHKWEDLELATEVAQHVPLAFWYFDLVESKDEQLIARTEFRREWILGMEQACHIGFCTDGDWVNKRRNKLYWLMQGADERVAGIGECKGLCAPIVFTGCLKHGSQRLNHLTKMKERWGNQLACIGTGGMRTRLHGRDLANLFASCKVVIAPNGPQTDRYWSNRVYLTLGFGGFLLHPYCEQLTKHYRVGEELIYYKSEEQLDWLIQRYISEDSETKAEREAFRLRGYQKTMRCHTYRHRCERLLDIVAGRLGVR